MGWRKWNRIIHRDAGYFFFGLFIIYAVSGIALNHRDDWNPNYIITNQRFTYSEQITRQSVSNEFVSDLLVAIDEKPEFKKYYFPNPNTLKIFIEDGSVILDVKSGHGLIEKIKKRPIFKDINFLHYNNPKKFWTFYADLFAAFMIIIAISGLIIVRGKNGFKKRGLWFVLAGIIAPIVILILFS
jgi:hypothetical protein